MPLPPNVPSSILAEEGYNYVPKIGASLAYDTRNSVQLPNKGQRTDSLPNMPGDFSGGEKNFYKLELRTAWYFPGFARSCPGNRRENRSSRQPELGGCSVL